MAIFNDLHGSACADGDAKAAPVQELAWQPRFETGVGALDEQHRALVAHVAEVARLVRDRAPKEQLVSAVGTLARFTAEHFAHEERLMAGSPGAEDTVHLEHHRELLGQIERFARRVETRPCPRDAARTVAFLKDWVSHHILHSDRKLATHLLAQNASPGSPTE